MDSRYTDWIIQNVAGDGYGQCAQATLAMAAAFPELTRVRGHYYDPIWGKRTHWWCVTADGTVVDPTALQFPSKGAGDYAPWIEGAAEPTGKCPDCGALVYGRDSFCSSGCERRYMAYLNTGRL